jgi:hypothetical protein
MPPARYSFPDIFFYNPIADTILPRVTIFINNARLQAGVPITRGTYTGGLNLFNYIGKDMAARWDAGRKELTIVGFY